MDSMQLTCAKNDDVSMLDSIDCLQRDQSGKRLIDYILEYKSVKVFSFLIEENPKRLFDNLFDNRLGVRTSPDKQAAVIDDLVYLCLISNKVEILEQYKIMGVTGVSSVTGISLVGSHGIKSMWPRRLVETRVNGQVKSEYIGVLTDKCFEAIADPSIVTDETFDYILSPSPFPPTQKLCRFHEEESYWVPGLSCVADKCYELGQIERLEKVLQVIQKYNEASCDALRKNGISQIDYSVYTKQVVQHNKIYIAVDNFKRDLRYICGYLPILKQTFEKVLERGDFETLDRFIAINKVLCGFRIPAYIPSEDEKRVSRANHDDSLTKGQKAVAQCIHSDILNLDELMEVDDEEAVREALENYPIDIIEWIDYKINADDWQALFKYAVDLKSERSITDDDVRGLIASATARNGESYKTNYSNLAKKVADNNRINRERYKYIDRFSLPETKGSFDLAVEKIKQSKSEFLDDYLFKKHGAIVNYPKELFEKYYENGEYERAAITLCTRMEVLFKDKYKLEGDLCTMIDEFAEKQKIGPIKKDLLHSVRMYRNSIVHPSSTDDADKLKNLDIRRTIRSGIDYICSLS